MRGVKKLDEAISKRRMPATRSPRMIVTWFAPSCGMRRFRGGQDIVAASGSPVAGSMEQEGLPAGLPDVVLLVLLGWGQSAARHWRRTPGHSGPGAAGSTHPRRTSAESGPGGFVPSDAPDEAL